MYDQTNFLFFFLFFSMRDEADNFPVTIVFFFRQDYSIFHLRTQLPDAHVEAQIRHESNEVQILPHILDKPQLAEILTLALLLNFAAFHHVFVRSEEQTRVEIPNFVVSPNLINIESLVKSVIEHILDDSAPFIVRPCRYIHHQSTERTLNVATAVNDVICDAKLDFPVGTRVLRVDILAFQDAVKVDIRWLVGIVKPPESINVGEIFIVNMLEIVKLRSFPVSKSKLHFIVDCFIKHFSEQELVFQVSKHESRPCVHELKAIFPPEPFWIHSHNLPDLAQAICVRVFQFDFFLLVVLGFGAQVQRLVGCTIDELVVMGVEDLHSFLQYHGIKQRIQIINSSLFDEVRVYASYDPHQNQKLVCAGREQGPFGLWGRLLFQQYLVVHHSFEGIRIAYPLSDLGGDVDQFCEIGPQVKVTVTLRTLSDDGLDNINKYDVLRAGMSG